jgi:uncharacterized membrane protein
LYIILITSRRRTKACNNAILIWLKNFESILERGSLIHSKAGPEASTIAGGNNPAPQVDPPPAEAPPVKPGEEQPIPRSQLTIVLALIVGYAALSYYSDSVPDAPNLAAGLSLAPVVLIGLALAWRWTRPVVTVLIFATTCAVLYRYWAFIRSNYQWSNLVQQTGAYGLVALGFARSLSGGREPLCTQMADRLHGPLTPAEVAYTRRATIAWAIFYAALTVAIAALFFAASPRVWSLFVNFATFGLIGLMFAVEHTVRQKVLPPRQRGSTLVAIRQFLIG